MILISSLPENGTSVNSNEDSWKSYLSDDPPEPPENSEEILNETKRRWNTFNKYLENPEDAKKQPKVKKQDHKFINCYLHGHPAWKIVRSNLDNPEGYIVAVLKSVKEKWEYYGGLNLDDYINLGRIGLMKAAKKFDPEKGKFSSYAWNWVKGELMNGTDGIGWSAQQYKAMKLYMNIPEDLKARLKLKKQNLKALKEDVEKPNGYKEEGPLSKGKNEEGEIEFTPKEASDLFADLRDDKDEIVPRVEIKLLKKALEKLENELGKEYRVIFEEKYADGKSLREIAKKDEITVSYRTVGRYLKQAEEKMGEILGVRVTK